MGGVNFGVIKIIPGKFVSIVYHHGESRQKPIYLDIYDYGAIALHVGFYTYNRTLEP
jgi:hypothetical protein